MYMHSCLVWLPGEVLISSPAASSFGAALLPSALPTFLAVISIIYTISLPLKLLHWLCTMEAAVAPQACSADVRRADP